MALPAYDQQPPEEKHFLEEGQAGDLGDMEEPEPWLPSTDAQTERLVEEAVEALARARSWTTPRGPVLRMRCLVSLIAEAEASTYEYVAAAYEAGYGWDALAWATGDFLGDLQGAYGPYVEWRGANKEGSTG